MLFDNYQTENFFDEMFTSDGTPNNLHIVRSMRGALGRRIALGASSRRELQACLKHGAPYLTGPAITATLDRPLEPTPCPVFKLPLHDWSHSAAAVGEARYSVSL